jgi:hypothetical protein
MTFELNFGSWGRARDHTEQDLENTAAEGMVEFGSSTKSVAPYGRCDKAHCHGVGSGCFYIFQPSPPSVIPHMLQDLRYKQLECTVWCTGTNAYFTTPKLSAKVSSMIICDFVTVAFYLGLCVVPFQEMMLHLRIAGEDPKFVPSNNL